MNSFTILFILGLFKSITPIPKCPALAMDFHAMGIDCETVAIKHTPFDSESAKMVEEATKCAGYGAFKVDKSFGCSSPTLPPNLILDYPCDCKFGGHCSVFCSENYDLQGPRSITCLRNGSWSQLPKCVLGSCGRPKISSRMVFKGGCSFSEGETCNLTCISSAYRIEPSPSITCYHKIWSPLPKCEKFCRMEEIPHYLELEIGADECSGRENHYCTFRCKNNLMLFGTNNFICSGGVWKAVKGHSPICGCDFSKLPASITWQSSCIPAVGTECSAECHNGYAPANEHKAVLCDDKGNWDEQNSIKCVQNCPFPISLPSDLELVSPCKGTASETCKVACKDNSMQLVGKDEFQCLPTGQYSPFPFCAKDNKCSSGAFPKEVRLLPGCTFNVGEKCKANCTDAKASLATTSTVTCLGTLAWSEAPKCVHSCRSPDELNSYLHLGVCHLHEGGTCQVRCKDGFSAPTWELPGFWKIFTCLPSGDWDIPFFTCFEVCPEPQLDKNTVAIRPCKDTPVGKICRLACRTPDFVIRQKIITCLKTRSWNNIPKCNRKCRPPQLPPHLELVKGCTFMEGPHPPCKVRCVDPRLKLLGEANIACTPEGMLLKSRTECGTPCKYPEHPDYLSIYSCRELGKQRAKCSVMCSEPNHLLLGSDVIQCEDGKWNLKGTCEKRCSTPLLQPNTTLEGECLFITNFPCHVTCLDPSLTLGGLRSQVIVCADGSWNWTAECERICPDPLTLELETDMVMERGCSRTPGSTCRVKCLGRKTLNPTLTCGEDLQWHPRHVHCDIVCERPNGDINLVMDESRPCSFHAFEKCYVKCINNGTLIGEPFIYCEGTGVWSEMPTCEPTCLDPPTHFMVVNEKDCAKGINTSCLVFCKNITGKNFINQCSFSGEWELPWPPPNPYCGAVNKKRDWCDAPEKMKIVECIGNPLMCYFECQNESLHVLGGEARALCKNKRLDAKGRSCGVLLDIPCDPKDLPPYLKLTEKKPYKMLNAYKFSCPKDMALKEGEAQYIVCEPGGQWGPFPKCDKKCFPFELFKFGLRVRSLNYPCYIGYCPIECVNRRLEPELELAALCRQDGTWAPPKGKCVKKEPNLIGFSERCGPLPSNLTYKKSNTRNSNEQVVSCKNKIMKLVGPRIVKCLKNKQFTMLPECRLPDVYDTGSTTRGKQCKFNPKKNRGDLVGPEVVPPGTHTHVIDSICVSQFKKKETVLPLICMKNLEFTKPICENIYYPPKEAPLERSSMEDFLNRFGW